MAVILQVNFASSPSLAAQSQQDKLDSARQIAQLPGLHWKIWLHDEVSGTRSGVYLFEDRERARDWVEKLTARLAETGATKISIRYFDINVESSRITRAPIDILSVAA